MRLIVLAFTMLPRRRPLNTCRPGRLDTGWKLWPPMLSAVVLLLSAFVAHASPDADTTIWRDRLRANLDPNLRKSCLAVTIVRTEMQRQPLTRDSRQSAATTERTLVGEVLLNAHGAKEKVLDTRLAGLRTKQGVFSYSNDGGIACYYDESSPKSLVQGVIRKATPPDVGRMSLVLGPDACKRNAKLLMEQPVLFLDRLDRAEFISATECRVGQSRAVRLEGRYSDSDPYSTFVAVLLPDSGNALANLDEYDANGRAISEFRAEGFRRLDTPSEGSFWVPSRMSMKHYGRDDVAGDSQDLTLVDLLDPTCVDPGAKSFSLQFPSSAHLFDANMEVNPDDMLAEVAKSLSHAEQSSPAEATAPSGGDMRARAQALYLQEKHRGLRSSAQDSLLFPHSPLQSPLVAGLGGAVAVLGLAIPLYRLRSRKRMARAASLRPHLVDTGHEESRSA